MKASIQQIQTAVQGWSIEVTPAGAARIDSFADCLSPGTTVNVTFLPGSDPMETVAVAKRLHNEGMNAVPHLAARSLKDSDQIDTLLASYRAEAAVRAAALGDEYTSETLRALVENGGKSTVRRKD